MAATSLQEEENRAALLAGGVLGMHILGNGAGLSYVSPNIAGVAPV
jgi:hypothetical protein